MELVRGVKITEYCNQHSLTTEDRLRLFVQVCQAVQQGLALIANGKPLESEKVNREALEIRRRSKKLFGENMRTNGDQVEVFANVEALTLAAARRFAQLAEKAVEDHGICAVALSGGSTPKMLYRLMATDLVIRSAVPWSKIHFFFGDERHVPPDHPDSNFRMASEAMLQSLKAEQLHVHRVLAELSNAAEAAAQYEVDLREFFEPHGLVDEGFPRFDLILLGMGPDGHTASLFPNSPGLHETTRWVAANWVQKFQTDRITMTFPVLNSAAEVILFVSGSEKAAVLGEVLKGAAQKYPVQQVRPRNGIKRWMLDAAAAAGVGTKPG